MRRQAKVNGAIAGVARALALAGLPKTVTCVYVYGSLVTGRLREDSDVDIGLLASPLVSDVDRLILISRVEAVVSDALRHHGLMREVSVLDLRGKYVSLQLQYAVITNGMVVYDADMYARYEYENAVKGEYYDFKPFLARLRRRKYGNVFQKA